MRIGIFGGSFDPVHLGHVRLAEKILRAHALDRLFFVPVKRSPFKSAAPIAPAKDRLAMLRLAAGGMRGVQVSRCELNRPAPSYTIHTVKFFRKKFPKAELFLVMGKDARNRFKRWRSWREILRECRLAAAPRIGKFSSTAIRARLSRGERAAGLVPKKVERYIRLNRLYGKGRGSGTIGTRQKGRGSGTFGTRPQL